MSSGCPSPCARCVRSVALLLALLGMLAPAAADQQPAMALLIDDLGFRVIEDLAVLELDPRVSVAIIPNAPLARRVARLANAQQRIVLVHLPLTQGSAQECDAPLCPERAWSAERMRLHLDWAFSEVQGAAGLNNHQGSHFTGDLAATRRLLEGLELYSREQKTPPFIVDSRTTPNSRLATLASEAGFATTQRDIFLDHDRGPEALENAWQAAIALARRQGHAVVIAHPHPETIDFLAQALPKLTHAGVRLVPITEVLKQREAPPVRLGYPAAATAYRASTAPSAP